MESPQIKSNKETHKSEFVLLLGKTRRQFKDEILIDEITQEVEQARKSRYEKEENNNDR